MKIFIGFCTILLAFNAVLALPAKSPNDDAEVISVPRKSSSSEEDSTDFKDFKGLIDTGSGYPFLQPNPTVFSLNFGFFDAFDDIMRRFRERMWPAIIDDSDSTEIGTRGSFDLDSKGSNSTSTVKVVNGHKIEVNETVYGDDDSSFRVRVVNIRPLEAGEEVEEGVKTSVGSPKPDEKSPVTSSPKKDTENDDSNETREPLERDNEIRGNLNEQKNSEGSSNSISPTTTTIAKASNEDKRNGILNGTFVTDNRFEETEHRNGNIEAETNKPTENKMLENYDETNDAAASATSTATSEQVVETTTTMTTAESAAAPIDAIAEATEDVISSASVVDQHASLTIENNEETETNDNFNESSEDDASATATTVVAITKDLSKLTLNGNVNEQEQRDQELAAEELNTSSTFVLNGEVVVPVTSAIETFNVEHFGNDEGDGNGNGDGDADGTMGVNAENVEIENFENVEAAQLIKRPEHEHEGYASSSSDDEGAEPIEMNPVFQSEWENLAEDLKNSNDQNNDLSNDIDVYASVPVDLSNDIAVNDIAAAQVDFPINPDAEFIDVNGEITHSNSMPMFEKLSMSTSLHPDVATMK